MHFVNKASYGAAIAALFFLSIARCDCQTTGGGLLSNDGETGSLNALVQYLYNIPQFRKAVYASKDDTDFVTELQRIFFQIQYRGCADTSALADFEEWVFVENPGTADVSELRQVLLGNILSETDIDASIARLFRGRVENTIEASAVNFESSREETFLSIFLRVAGLDGLVASLNDYAEEEVLKGDNQIFVEDEGLVDGIRTSKFAELPPVLQLDFRRFTFNGVGVEKVDASFGYPTILDFSAENKGVLNEEAADTAASQRYLLHSVISHSGSADAGIFRTFALVSDQESGTDGWYRFDNEEVVSVAEIDAVEGLFGDGTESENAYLVTYVRMSDWDEVNAPTGKKDIPNAKRTLFEGEEADPRCMQ
ncbi:hypothetical protein BSKO_09237 [Bryopsis sp. KO-2023]|nr:hypothetical protein BSKO_09237 [Bryopsis sp. KO-2023]